MASSFYVTRLIKSLLNIGPKATKFPYYFSVFPCSASGFYTEKNVTERTLLMSTNCPICLQLKFGIFQAMVSVAFPILSSLTFYLPTAQAQNTISLPDIKNDTREGFKFCFKLLKARSLQFQTLAALQIPLVIVLPYLQEKQLENINNILSKKSEILE